MKLIPIILTYLLFSISILAQDIDIDFILEQVKKNNPDIRMKEIEAEISKKEVSKSFKNLILPPVSLSQSKNLDNLKSEDVKLNKLEATVSIFEGGKSYYTYKQSKV